MGTPPITDEELLECLAALDKAGGVQIRAANLLGFTRGKFEARMRAAALRGLTSASQYVPTAEPLPEKRPPIEETIAQRERAFDLRRAHNRAKNWRKFKVPTHGPYALMFFGDPHLDDDGCNLTLFKEHAALAASTEHLYAINIGDTTNNWVGRLARLWANQDASAETARALVKHYLVDSGIPWFLWLHGNHDLWDGPVGRDVFELQCPSFIAMEDWQAKVTLVSPNGHELRLWAAHNFKGTSQWNLLHGPLKAAQMGDWAHLYVAGHHHNWGMAQGEHEFRRFIYNVARVRGYKFIDDYADVNGFGNQENGAAMVAVVDPDTNKLNAVKCFHDPFEGVEFLTWKRAKLAA